MIEKKMLVLEEELTDGFKPRKEKYVRLSEIYMEEEKKQIVIKGAREHNLQNVDVEIPLNALSVITGVSGSGKSTLIRDILYPALQRIIHKYGEKAGRFTEISGDLKAIQNVEFINQNPIGRSSRSNPVPLREADNQTVR